METETKPRKFNGYALITFILIILVIFGLYKVERLEKTKEKIEEIENNVELNVRLTANNVCLLDRIGVIPIKGIEVLLQDGSKVELSDFLSCEQVVNNYLVEVNK